tara:strand:- start:306 stop:527 length:222 start_codon:yes stop_codon:yes gene_type:complete
MKSMCFTLEGVKCGKCVAKIKDYFSEVDGVVIKDVDVSSGRVTMDLNASLSVMGIKSQFKDIGFQVQKMEKVS